MPASSPDPVRSGRPPGAASRSGAAPRRPGRHRQVPTDPPPAGMAGAVVRITRIAARHPKTVVLLWLLLIAGCVFAGASTGMRNISSADEVIGDAGRAEQALERSGLAGRPAESILVRTASPAQTDAIAAPLAERLAAARTVARVQSPYRGGPADRSSRATDAEAGTAALRTTDGRAVLLRTELRGGSEDAARNAAAVTRLVDAARRAHRRATIAQAGSGSVDAAIDDIVADDLARAELLSLPITLLILVLAFGAVVAASVPLALGITAVAGAMGALGVVSHAVPNGDSTGSLVVLIGLAVGVDYSLFYVRREREERRRGHSPERSLELASASVGRAIIVAGTTVMVALAGLFLSGIATFASMAAGTILVVAIAVLGSLTVLPAMLALLGDRIDAGRVLGRRRARRARLARAGAPQPDRRARPSTIARFVHAVARRPVGALAVALALLLALAAPALHMRLGQGGTASLPEGIPAIEALAEIDASFGGSSEADLVVTGRALDSAAARAGLQRLIAAAARSTGAAGFAPVEISRDAATALVRIPMPDQEPAAAQQTVKRLRTDLAGPGADLVPGADRVLVGGDAAEGLDFRDTVVGAMPPVVLFVLGLALVLLLLAFRSLPLALVVIGLNLLSVGAAYGVMTEVFQHTWAEGLLDFTSNGAVTTWMPLLAFVILFGLSMDYSILVLERIREARAVGRSPREAAAEGVAATAGTVTGAAVVMVAVFSIFATLRLLEMKQLGVGLATAVLVDATLVRAIALPAAVALLGDRAFPGVARRAGTEVHAAAMSQRGGVGQPFRGSGEVCEDGRMDEDAALVRTDVDG